MAALNKQNRIAIIGAAGRLGGSLVKTAMGHAQVICYDRSTADLEDLNSLRSLVRKSGWDIVIISAAMTNVDACEDHPELAWRINAHAPEIIAQSAPNTTRIVYVSTDFVFAGDTRKAYQEIDPALPCNIYGRAKLAGEQAILAADPNHLVIRSSWLFGGKRPAFPDIMIERARYSTNMDIINDRWSCPTHVDDLSKAILMLLSRSDTHGIYHYCNEGACSPYEYGRYAINIARSEGLPLMVDTITPVSTPQSGVLKANRPTHSVLDTSRYTAITNQTPRPWQQSLKEYVACLVLEHQSFQAQ